ADDRRRRLLDGLRGRLGDPRRRGGPRPRGPAAAVRHRRLCGVERPLRGLRRRHRAPHRRRALRGVVRVRRAAAGRVPGHPGGGLGAVVAPGARRQLAGAGGAGLGARGPRGPSGDPRLLERRGRLRRLGGGTVAHRGRVGVRRPWRARRSAVPVGGRARARRPPSDERVAGPLPRPQQPRRRLLRDGARRRVRTQRPRPPQRLRQRLGVVLGLACARRLRARRRDRPARPGTGQRPRHARRLVSVPRVLLPPLPRLRAQRQHSRQLDRQPRLPLCRRRL
ncbi:MAG: Sulfatase modifying factor 1 precursor (C-alpha-formyglycine- generating enzyme 1), partial [uncultured Solirubrobacteraceae bacterium]